MDADEAAERGKEGGREKKREEEQSRAEEVDSLQQ